jgi:nicotinamide-nucleotide amidase
MSSTIRVETITLGDELLLGIRENSHLTYLGTQLAHHGIEPAANLVIRDNPDDIKDFFSEAWKRSDLVITTGGLGPTTDDLTRESIAEALGEELIYDAEVEQSIRQRFLQLERKCLKLIYGSAIVPRMRKSLEIHTEPHPDFFYKRKVRF